MESGVIENGLDFILRAANDIWSEQLSPDQQLKYSTIELYEGVELLLKARLMKEHWSLILSRVDEYKKDSFEKGDFISVNYDSACERLRKLCDVEIDEKADDAFRKLKSLRNRYVHFSCDGPREAVMALQLQAWHHVLKLLEEEFLGPLSEKQNNILEEAREKMLRSDQFLDTRLNEVGPDIETAEASGQLVTNCPACDRSALLIGDGDPSCLVCLYEGSAKNVADDYAKASDFHWKHPRHGVDDDVAWCPGCGEQSVVPAGDDLTVQAGEKLPESVGDSELWICFSCGEPALSHWFTDCSYCGAKYVNGDSTCPACTMGF